MCGIVGYVGSGEASEFLIDGLRRLEYRGYDSAGIAVYEDGKIRIEKKQGRRVNLEKDLKFNEDQVLFFLNLFCCPLAAIPYCVYDILVKFRFMAD